MEPQKEAAEPKSSWSLETYASYYARLIKGHTPPLEDAVRASKLEAKEFFDHGIITRGCRVLDTGCGHGRSAIGMMDYGIGGYTGLDVISESIEFCQKAFAQVRGFDFRHLDVHNEFYNPNGKQKPSEVVFPVGTGAYDAVIAGSLYTHLGTKQICDHYLDESARALKSGGRIFCSWFRSPPNQVTDDLVRTVLTESDILDIVSKRFHIYFCAGGINDDYNNQWCLFGRKK